MKHFKLTIYRLTILLALTLSIVSSASAATEFTSMIDPDNGTGTDYTSLNTWEAANQVDLTATSTLVFSHGGIIGTIPDGSTVTGATSGIKGEVTHATSTQALIKDIRTTLTGTLTFTNASTAVSGTSTLFTTELAVGDYIWLDADSTWAEVSSITDDLNLVLTVAYTGTGGTGTGAVRKGNFTSGEQVYETLDTNYVIISDAGDSAIAVASCRSSNGTADTTAVTIDGWITSATNYIKVWTDPSLGNRHSGKWDERKYRLEVNLTTADYGIVVNDNYVTIDGLQIKVSRNTYAADGINVSSSVGDSTISNNIIRANFIDSAQSGIYAGIYIDNGTGQSNYVYNNIIYDFSDNYVDNTIAGIFGNYYAQYIYNNTIYNCDYGFFASNTMTGSCLINNIVQNSNVADYYFANGSANFDLIDYNISSDATAPGANSKTSQTVSFVSTTSGSEDLHLAQSDTSARDAGTDLSADANLPFSTDIDGSIRNADSQGWDIGADEVVSEIYRSVGPSNTSALDTDDSHADTITLTNGIAVFSEALANNIGVGDVIIYDSDLSDTLTSSDSIAFIKSRTDSTHYTIQTETGATPSDLTANDTWEIYRAYTSLYDAEEGIENSALSFLGITYTGGNRNLVVNNEQWNIACYRDAIDIASVIIDGWTTGVQNYIKIYTPTKTGEVGISQRHKGVEGNGYIHLSAGSSSFNINVDNVFVYGLEIDANDQWGIRAFNNNIIIAYNLIYNANGYNRRGIETGGSNNTIYVYDNILYNNAGSGYDGAIYVNGDSTHTAYIYNNTVVNSATGIRTGSSIAIVKNNLTQNCTDNGYEGTFDDSSDYNISSDLTSAGGANDKTSQTVSFISTTSGSEDFHLSSSDTSAKDAGTNLSTDSYLPFSTDVDGNSRPIGSGWDIGADECSFVQKVKIDGIIKFEGNFKFN